MATSEAAHAAPRSDVLFVLSSLAVGGSERKIVRMANRLKEEGVQRDTRLPQRPLHDRVRRCAATCRCAKLERQGKFSLRAVLRLRQMHRCDERPATVIAVNLYQALYVACATALLPHRPRTVALVNTSTFRGRRLWKRIYQLVLARFDHTVHGSQAQRRFWVDDESPRA